MNNIIKEKMEKYVIEKFEDLDRLDPTQDEYKTEELHTVKIITTLVETLQREDINENNCKINLEKVNNEIKKIDCEREIAITKIETEVDKNDKMVDLESKKIDNSYKLEAKKIENEIAKIKIDKTKINNDYEINIQKIQVETDKNENNNVLESKKIDHVVDNDKMNLLLKDKELSLNTRNINNLNVEKIAKVLIDGAAVVLPVILYNVWMKRGFEFEETGTYTSNTFKNIIGKFKPTK